MNQGSRTLVYRFVQNSLLHISRAGIDLPSSFVLVILMCSSIAVQSVSIAAFSTSLLILPVPDGCLPDP